MSRAEQHNAASGVAQRPLQRRRLIKKKCFFCRYIRTELIGQNFSLAFRIGNPQKVGRKARIYLVFLYRNYCSKSFLDYIGNAKHVFYVVLKIIFIPIC